MIRFIIKETFRSILEAKYSTFFALVSLLIGCVLIYISIGTLFLSQELEKSIKENYYVVVYLKENIVQSQIDSLSALLKADNAVINSKFISKAEAEKSFIAETGEDFRSILNYNPLPASILLFLDYNNGSKTEIDRIIKSSKSHQEIESAEYKAEIFEKASQVLKNGRFYLIGLTLILIIVAVYVVYSTQKLILLNRKNEIITMKLVGASESLIKLPIYLNGIVIGFFSSLIAWGAILAILYFWSDIINFDVLSITKIYPLVLITFFTGPILGALGSFFSSIKIYR